MENLRKKLTLNKKTIARINDDQLKNIVGGEGEDVLLELSAELDFSEGIDNALEAADRPRTSKGRTCGATQCHCPTSRVSVCLECK